MPKHVTIQMPMLDHYEDTDDALAAAAADAADLYGCHGYDMAPRWLDDLERTVILVDVPAWAVTEQADGR